MKLCLIADLHLPCHPDAVHYGMFEWALQDLQKKGGLPEAVAKEVYQYYHGEES